MRSVGTIWRLVFRSALIVMLVGCIGPGEPSLVTISGDNVDFGDELSAVYFCGNSGDAPLVAVSIGRSDGYLLLPGPSDSRVPQRDFAQPVVLVTLEMQGGPTGQVPPQDLWLKETTVEGDLLFAADYPAVYSGEENSWVGSGVVTLSQTGSFNCDIDSGAVLHVTVEGEVTSEDSDRSAQISGSVDATSLQRFIDDRNPD